MPTGTLTRFNRDRGFGHIRRDDDAGPDVFVHVTALKKAGIFDACRGDV